MSFAHNIVHSINDTIYRQQKNKQRYIDIYLNATYETNAFLSSIALFPQMLNIIQSNRYEVKARAAQIKRLKKSAQSIAREFFYGDKTLNQISMNPSGAVFSLSIITYFKWARKSHEEKLKEIQQGVKDSMLAQGLQQNKTSDDGHIYTDPFNHNEAAFTPKTILNIYNYKQEQPIYNQLKVQMENILNMGNEERSISMNRMIETRIITEKDCKREKISTVLVGQKGIYAKENIKKNTVIGFYAGIYIADAIAQKKVFGEFGAQQCGLYMFSFPKKNYPRVSGYQYGNKTCLINASITYEKSVIEIAKQYHTFNNVSVVYAKSGENPDAEYLNDMDSFDLVSYVATKDVKKGEQFFIDYGMNYWKNRISTTIDATQEEVSRAIQKYESKMKHKDKQQYKFK